MANYNARDFLRDSIAGNTSGGISQPKANENLTNSKFPPILILPPNISKEEFVYHFEKKHQINIIPNLPDIDHSLILLENAFKALDIGNIETASDIISLCLILEDNYFYNYLLALIRFNLGDSYESLLLIKKSINQLGLQQKLAEFLSQIINKIDFIENLYTLYIFCLLDNKKDKEAEEASLLIVSHQLVKKISLLMSLILQSQLTENKIITSLLSKYVLSKIKEITDINLRDRAFFSLKEILNL